MTSRQDGISLVEVLVSLVILSVGLLAIATMQLKSLRINQQSEYRSTAVQQINALADRMRVNLQAAHNQAYHFPTAPSSANACTSCSPTDLARNDVFQWDQQLQQLLPLGQGQVSQTTTGTTITVLWDGNKTGTPSKQLRMTLQL